MRPICITFMASKPIKDPCYTTSKYISFVKYDNDDD